MPRSKPPKPLTLILPPPSQYTNPSTTSSPPTLEVLLLAQQIASKRGQVFDVEAFIAPDQKEEYYRRIHRTPRQLNKGESSPTSIPAPLPSTTADLSVVVTEPDPEITVETESIPPTPLPHDAPTPNADPTSTSTPSSPTKRVKPPLPNLAHLHWKKRLKILNQIEAGIPISEGELLPPTPLPDGLRGKGLTGKDKEGIQGSASYWNSLLIQARKSRGPQWDYNTQLYHLDRGSKPYYTHMDKLARDRDRESKKKEREDGDKEIALARAREEEEEKARMQAQRYAAASQAQLPRHMGQNQIPGQVLPGNIPRNLNINPNGLMGPAGGGGTSGGGGGLGGAGMINPAALAQFQQQQYARQQQQIQLQQQYQQQQQQQQMQMQQQVQGGQPNPATTGIPGMNMAAYAVFPPGAQPGQGGMLQQMSQGQGQQRGFGMGMTPGRSGSMGGTGGPGGPGGAGGGRGGPMLSGGWGDQGS